MLSYAPFEIEEEQQPVAPVSPPPNKQGVRPRHRGRSETECAHLLIFFIFGIAIISVTN